MNFLQTAKTQVFLCSNQQREHPWEHIENHRNFVFIGSSHDSCSVKRGFFRLKSDSWLDGTSPSVQPCFKRFLFVVCKFRSFRSFWWFPELPALWSKPSSRPVLLPAGQSGLCSRCQHNAQSKRQLLLSPNSGCDNWDNRLNSSWSSPLMSSMRLDFDFQEFFSRISGQWLKEGTPCWYSSWKFPAIIVALLIGW